MNKEPRSGSRTTRLSVSAAESALPREALRLLAALAAPGAYAFPDPIEGGTLLLRSGGAGVSVGGGRFPAACGDSRWRPTSPCASPAPAAG